MIRIVVSLTTIPSRLKFLDRVVRDLLNQTHLPDTIYLHIPRYSKKENRPYDVDSLRTFLPSDSRLLINICDDYGPITKLIPTLDLETDPETLIIIVDDDMHYYPDRIKQLLTYAEEYPNAAIGGDGWIISSGINFLGYVYQPSQMTKVSILQGCSGCLFRRKFFPHKGQDLLDFRDLNPDLRKSAILNDDLWISAYLASRHIDRYVHPGYKKKTTFLSKINAISTNPLSYLLKSYPLINHFRKKNLFLEKQVAPPYYRVGFWVVFVPILFFLLFLFLCSRSLFQL